MRDEMARFTAHVRERLLFARVQWVPELEPNRLAFLEDTPDRMLAGRDVFDQLVRGGFECAGEPPPPWARRHELEPSRAFARLRGALGAVDGLERLRTDGKGGAD
jgi:hypothetical protein